MSLLAIRNISIHLGKQKILKNVDMAVESGQMTGLIGPNGAGKTTLLRVAAGLIAPDAGTVTLSERPLHEWDHQERARRLAYLSQTADSQWQITVETLVSLGRLPYHDQPVLSTKSKAQSHQAAIESALEACDILALRNRPVDQLSGGERARVMLARVLAGTPKVLLADEPVTGLDPAHQMDVMERLHRLTDQGTGVVVVLHDLTLAARYCDRLILLHQGRVAITGTARSVLTDRQLAQTFGITVIRGESGGKPFIIPQAKAHSAPASR